MYDPLRAKARVALSVAGCFLLGLGVASHFGFTEAPGGIVVVDTAPRVATPAAQPALDLSEAFVNVADAVTPAVVMIGATRQRPQAVSGFDRFRFFREPPGGRMPDLGEVGGSGFIITKDGYVMTNNHVIEDAERITVSLQDGRTFDASVVGTDPTTDIALIRVEGEDLPTVSLGSSAEVRVGEWVLAIGNPGFATGGSPDLDYTVTAGIVSAKGRSLRLINRSLSQDPEMQDQSRFAIEDFIQTDAVINSGNSGGPMVNLRGQVIGINSAIVSRTGVYQGYGFAIPIDLAHRVMEDLVEYGRVKRAYIGVEIRDVSAEDAEVLKLPEVSGAFVVSVTTGEPAERAGLRANDVITAIDGHDVLSGNDLQHKIALRSPGEDINITVHRQGRPLDVSVQAKEAPFSGEQTAQTTPSPRHADKVGIDVVDITPDIARQLQLETPDGVVVRDVQEGGPAARKGIQRGCVIREINGRTIKDADDVADAFEGVEAGTVVSLIAACLYRDMRDAMYNIRVPG